MHTPIASCRCRSCRAGIQQEAVAEIKRVAAKGAKAITLPELPHIDGLPSYHNMDHWGPIFEALIDNGLVMCLHIGQGFAALQLAPDGPVDNLMIMACQISMLGAQDLLWGPAFRTYPELKVAFSEGGIGWLPFYLDRCDRHFTNQVWLHGEDDFGGKLPSEVFREHALACYVTDPTSFGLRKEIGIDIIAWECDYPHSDSIWPDAPEKMLGELNAVGATDEEIDKISLAERLPLLRLGPVPEGEPRRAHGRRAACPGDRRRRVDDDPQGVRRALRARPRRHLSRGLLAAPSVGRLAPTRRFAADTSTNSAVVTATNLADAS